MKQRHRASPRRGKRIRVLASRKSRQSGHAERKRPGVARRDRGFFRAPAMLLRIPSGSSWKTFADPAVGAVSGLYKVVKAEQVNIGKLEDLYWKYETFLKVKESHWHPRWEVTATCTPFARIFILIRIPNHQRRLCDSGFSAAKGYRAVYEPHGDRL